MYIIIYKVFVATDNADVIEETKRALGDGFQVSNKTYK